MKILVVATKPPWPACDGGRLVLWHTLRGLARAGHEIRLIAPVPAGGAAGREERGVVPVGDRRQAHGERALGDGGDGGRLHQLAELAAERLSWSAGPRPVMRRAPRRKVTYE